LAKYVILYNVGGIYIDIDCEALKSLNEIPGLNTKDLIISETDVNIFENLLMTFSFNNKYLNNGILLSSPKNIYLKTLIDEILNINILKTFNPFLINKQYHIMNTTGPTIFTNIMSHYKNDPNVLILDHEYFEPCLTMDKFCKVSSKAIFNHKHELTWTNNFIKSIITIYMYIKAYFIFYLCVLCLIIVYMIINFPIEQKMKL